MPSASTTLTLRLTARQRAAVRRLAAREGVSEEEAVCWYGWWYRLVRARYS